MVIFSFRFSSEYGCLELGFDVQQHRCVCLLSVLVGCANYLDLFSVVQLNALFEFPNTITIITFDGFILVIGITMSPQQTGIVFLAMVGFWGSPTHRLIFIQGITRIF